MCQLVISYLSLLQKSPTFLFQYSQLATLDRSQTKNAKTLGESAKGEEEKKIKILKICFKK